MNIKSGDKVKLILDELTENNGCCRNEELSTIDDVVYELLDKTIFEVQWTEIKMGRSNIRTVTTIKLVGYDTLVYPSEVELIKE